MALGRGLDALLGDTTLQAQTGGSVNLPISQVEPGLNQPRKHFDEEALADLAESIRQHGMLQPLTVRRLASGYYQIIAGERRWRAARQAGLEEVPAIIIEADDRKVMELGLIENLQREDLNPMEEAAGYRTLIQDYGLTQEEAARRVSKSRPAVANAMRLLALPQEVQWLIEQGNLSAGHGRALLALLRRGDCGQGLLRAGDRAAHPPGGPEKTRPAPGAPSPAAVLCRGGAPAHRRPGPPGDHQPGKEERKNRPGIL